MTTYEYLEQLQMRINELEALSKHIAGKSAEEVIKSVSESLKNNVVASQIAENCERTINNSLTVLKSQRRVTFERLSKETSNEET